ncbi:hypothetical protein ACIRPN_17805 [Streptomyces sp. NPDC101230]|uniref:hypothetical protein n=1 Tax=unclassified Streptomyces TaxID=2593676 RepID=UPI00380D4EAF
MTDRLPPGDPAELYLRISYTDALSGTPYGDTLEWWDVAVLHAQDEFAVGSMVFYRVHLDRRGMHAAHAMEDESEDLAEIASVILDAETGYFTDDVSDTLDYVGSALLVSETRSGAGLRTSLRHGTPRIDRLTSAACDTVSWTVLRQARRIMFQVAGGRRTER